MTYEPEHGTRQSEERPAALTGSPVLDRALTKVGKVTDVLFADGAPEWAVVKTGILGGEHFVPLEQSYVDLRGRLIVPLDKSEIRHAPRAAREHVVTSRIRNQLLEYYGRAA